MMNAGKFLVLLLTAMLAGEATAQAETAETGRLDAERGGAAEADERARRDVVDIEAEMRVAEERLAEAARRIAELSTRRLPRIGGERFAFDFSGRPMLGITIDGDTESGPAEGVRVNGVTPGGAAAAAGLRAGDILTAVNTESLSAENTAVANQKLLDFLQGVEEGDALDIEYLRDGEAGSVSVTPQSRRAYVYSFGNPGPGMEVPVAPLAPLARVLPDFAFLHGEDSWGDMEMAALTADLGRYFGTDKGLLVVRAPSDENLKLKDGDVIHAIDGREPTSVSHAVRILGSYQSGEALKLEIMRDKRRQTLDIEMPDNRRSQLPLPPGPAVAIDVEPTVKVRRVTRQ